LNAAEGSPVLREARAIGRALRASGAALLRGETWILLVALGLLFPWFVVLWSRDLLPAGDRGPGGTLSGGAGIALDLGGQAVLHVLLLALLVPLLDGRREIAPGRLRPAGPRLLGIAAALAGAGIAEALCFALGWMEPLAGILGWRAAMGLGDLLFAAVRAWVAASVIAATRGDRAWPWGAGNLLAAGAFFFAGEYAAGALLDVAGEALWWASDGMEEATVRLPPPFFVAWRLADSLSALAALEYLRAAAPPPAAGAPA